MSSLISNLLRGTAGLTAQSKGLEVTGNNLTNANTAGYSRQSVSIDSGGTFMGAQGLETMGVRIGSVDQARDVFLDRQVISEKSGSAAAQATSDIYGDVETALGQNINTDGGATSIGAITGNPGGINSALSAFFNAVQSYASNPTDASAKNVVLSQAATLSDKINTADSNLAAVQTRTTEKMNSDVSVANNLLGQIADYNQKISRFETASSDKALALRDQRQSALEQLSSYLNFTTKPDPSGNGQIQLSTTDASGAAVALVDQGVVANSLSFNGTGFQAGTSALGLTSGSLPAQLAARDGFAQSVRNDLSSFATQLRTAVNSAYNPGGTGGDFYAAGTGGKLIDLASGLSTSTLRAGSNGDSGSNDIATAVASVGTQKFSTAGGDVINGTLSGYFSSVVSRVGTAVSSSASALEAQKLAETLATNQRDQVSGVSLDEETANLMKYQRAFQASARYINVIDQMLDTVVNRMGN